MHKASYNMHLTSQICNSRFMLEINVTCSDIADWLSTSLWKSSPNDQVPARSAFRICIIIIFWFCSPLSIYIYWKGRLQLLQYCPSKRILCSVYKEWRRGKSKGKTGRRVEKRGGEREMRRRGGERNRAERDFLNLYYTS